MEDTFFGVPVHDIRLALPTVPWFSPSYPTTTTTEVCTPFSPLATLLIPSGGPTAAVQTVAKSVVVVVPPPSPTTPILLASNGDDNFSGASIASGITSRPLSLSQARNYIVGSVLLNVVSMPSKFHDITPIVVSEGNDDFFRVSSAVATTATEIPPPHATMGTVVTVLFVVLGPPSSSQVSSPTLFPSPPTPTFSMASSATETFFSTISQPKAARRTIHIAVVDVVVPPLTYH